MRTELAQATANCPPLDLLAQCLREEVEESESILAHLDRCPQCQEALASFEVPSSSPSPRPSNSESMGPSSGFIKHLKNAGPPPGIWHQFPSTHHAGSRGAPGAPSGYPRINGYELLEELGHGGMGIVYKARQINLDRTVALKLLHESTVNQPELVVRFCTEAEAIAQVEHPGIIQIYDVGECEGALYLALEHVEGGNLAQRLASSTISVPEAAKLVSDLAQAVHAAHRKGIVHRDLKPENVLLKSKRENASSQGASEMPGSPAASWSDLRPLITDFGLAKRIDQTALTRTGDVMGTPSYMAPEQASGKPDGIGPATDIYALGVILYQMLTGRPPFVSSTPLETLHQIVQTDPVPPSLLSGIVPRDLETICLCCLQKEPHKRYRNAEALAEDLQRFLEGKPIQARPAGRMERAWKWTRRHPALATLGAVSTVALLIMLVGSWLFTWKLAEGKKQAETAEQRAKEKELEAIRAAAQAKGKKKEAETQKAIARKERDKAKEEKLRTEVMRYAFQIQLARALLDQENYAKAEELLETTPKPLRGWEHQWLWTRCRKQFFQSLPGRKVHGISSNSRYLVTTDKRTTHLWSTGDRKSIYAFASTGNIAVRFSPDKRVKMLCDRRPNYREVDLTTGKEIKTVSFQPALGRYQSLHFSRDQKVALGLTQNGKTLYGIEISSGRTLWQQHFLLQDRGCSLIALPNRDEALVARHASGISCFDVKTGQKKPFPPVAPFPRGSRIAISHDGHHFAVVSQSMGGILYSTHVKIYQTSNGKLLFEKSFPTRAGQLAFTDPTLPHIAIVSGPTIEIWDFQSGIKLRAIQPHLCAISDLTVSANDSWLCTTGDDRRARIFPLKKTLTAKLAETGGLHWGLSPKGDLLACGHRHEQVVVWRTKDWKQLFATPPGKPRFYGDPAFSPNGTRLAIPIRPRPGDKDGQLEIWNVKTKRREALIPIPDRAPHRVGFTPNGNLLLYTSPKKSHFQIEVWDWKTKKALRKIPLPYLCLSDLHLNPQGTAVLLKAMGQKVVQVLQLDTGKVHHRFKHRDGVIQDAIFSPDGRSLASIVKTTGQKSIARLWDVSSGKCLCQMPFDGVSFRILFSPDGKRLIIHHFSQAIGAHVLSFLDIQTRQQILEIELPGLLYVDFRFSSDGSTLGYCGKDDILGVWSARETSR